MGRFSIIFVALFLISTPLAADVVDATPAGFSIKIAIDVNASASSVYRALLQIGSWWDPAHTWSGQASNLSLDPRAGGCFCETLPAGSVQHMTVTFVDAPRTLHMAGGLGPLGTLAVTGSMAWTLAADGPRTRLELSYNVGGYVPAGLNNLAPVVDSVLSTQVQRLKKFAETGRTP